MLPPSSVTKGQHLLAVRGLKMPIPTVPYQLSFSHLPPSLGSATQEEVMVQHPWLYIGLPGVRVKTDKEVLFTPDCRVRQPRQPVVGELFDQWRSGSPAVGELFLLQARLWSRTTGVRRELMMTVRRKHCDWREFWTTVGRFLFSERYGFSINLEFNFKQDAEGIQNMSRVSLRPRPRVSSVT